MADAALVRVIADFEAQQQRNRAALEKHFAHAVSLVPALAGLEGERLRLLYGADTADAQSTKEALTELATRRAGLLESIGLPKDYLDMTCRCADCRDTGFVGGPVKTRCACFLRRLNEERYAPNDTEILKKQSFENYDLGVFPNEVPPDSKTPQREYMRQLRDICLEYAKAFPENDKPNLLLYGNTGLGKTYLLNCVTGYLLNRSFNVLRFTAFSLGEFCLQKHLGSGADLSALVDADLLVYDDLGSEPLASELRVICPRSTFCSRARSRASAVVRAARLSSPLAVKSRFPPSLPKAMASSRRARLRERWVGRNCWMGISVSSTTWRMGRRPRAPPPTWRWTSPTLPPSIPPTRASAAMRLSSSNVGCEERWSEMAISPTPMTLGISATSFRRPPVMVAGGIWYEPE